MVSDQRTAFSSYMTRLLSTGRVVFSREEARQALGVSDGALLDAAERQQRKQHLVSPRRGFYVIVPPQYLAWGAPPPPWYIDDLMRHEGRPYYVGLLKAAELHGATVRSRACIKNRIPYLSVIRRKSNYALEMFDLMGTKILGNSNDLQSSISILEPGWIGQGHRG